MFNIVLHEPEKPDNTGNIGRTCVATGSALHLIYPIGFQLTRKNIHHAGLDYWERLKLFTHDNYNDFLEYLKGARGTRPYDDRARATRPYDDGARATRPYDDRARATRAYDDGARATRPYDDGARATRPYDDGARATRAYDDGARATFSHCRRELYERQNEACDCECRGEHCEPSLWFATTKAYKSYTDVKFNDGDFIMFGKESAGIPEEILANDKEHCIRIPMIENERSLNLSNSVAIVLYEALRQNNFKGLITRGELHNLKYN